MNKLYYVDNLDVLRLARPGRVGLFLPGETDHQRKETCG